MGIFSKVWKGIKKAAKKIAKGIKKVFKKVGAAIGKLGIVGQIGMMFLMPYAMGALGSFFGATGKIATWGAKLLGPNSGFLSKAVGHTLNAINTAGTFIGKVYTGITETISAAFDVVTGKGTWTDFTDSAKSIFKAPGESLKLMDPTYVKNELKLAEEAAKASQTAITEVAADTTVTTETPVDTVTDTAEIITETTVTPTDVYNVADQNIINDINAYKERGLENLADDLVTKLSPEGQEIYQRSLDTSTIVDTTTTGVDVGADVVSDVATDEDFSLLGKMKQDIRDIDVEDIYEKGKETVISSAWQTGKQKIAMEMGYEVGDFNQYNISLPDLTDYASLNRGVFQEVDFMNVFAKNGQESFPYMLSNVGYINNLLGSPEKEYTDYMAAFGTSMYEPKPIAV